MTTTLKKIPTVAKVQEMINDKFSDAIEDNINIELNVQIDVKNKGTYNVGETSYEIDSEICYSTVTISDDNNVSFICYSKDRNDIELYIDSSDNKSKLYDFGSLTFVGDWTRANEGTTGNLPIWKNQTVAVDISAITLNKIPTDRKGILKATLDGEYTISELEILSNIKSITKPDDNKILTCKALGIFIYPQGSIYMSYNNINPGTFIGGTWESITSPIENAYFWKRTA